MAKMLLLTGVALVATGALAAFAPATHRGSTQQSAQRRGPGPMCRRAPVLGALAPETKQPPTQQQRRGAAEDLKTFDAAESATDSAPPPPLVSPPPPPLVASPTIAPVAERGTVASEIAVTGSRRSASARSVPVAPPPPPGIAPMPRQDFGPPAGLLTAGDHDDLLNPLLYARYANRARRDLGQRIAAIPRVDTRNLLTVAVEDEAGRAAPFVPVTLTCADGNTLTLSTLADGSVAFFPALDRLGQRVRVTAGGTSRLVELGGPGGERQTMVSASPSRPVRKFDLMIALDTTGSMGDEIQYLKSELRSILANIAHRHPGLDVRVGLVAYRDIGDSFVTRTYPLTNDLSALQESLGSQYADGGGDMPEAMEQALARAVAQDWRSDAVKSMLLVADAPPHDENVARAFAITEAARARRIQIVPVAASGVDDSAQYFMRAAAAATQSRYIFLTDDSGIGNPHAEPDVDCYRVTRLDRMIEQVLSGQIAGRRFDPAPNEVIRAVGRSDHGRCILPPRFDVQ
ncbi:MAG: vWA domain-containing protein [Sphingomicrobium sp.]